MKKKTIGALALFMVTAMSFCGCNEEDNIQSIGEGGTCLLVNHNTKDSVFIYGGIYFGNPEYIYVHNGDMLEMTFIPNGDYEKFNFTVTYTLMDGSQHTCTNYDYTYKFTVSEWGTSDAKISFNAKYKEENIDITAWGTMNVGLLNND